MRLPSGHDVQKKRVQFVRAACFSNIYMDILSLHVVPDMYPINVG